MGTMEVGDIVQCPHCKTDLLIIREQPTAGSFTNIDHFVKINSDYPVDLSNGARMKCGKCLGNYYNLSFGILLHIKGKGWCGGKK